MDLKNTCELLLNIEQEVDVNAMSYEGTHLWPLVRQFLWVSSIQERGMHSEKKNSDLGTGEPFLRQRSTLLEDFYHIVTRSKVKQNLTRSLKAYQQSRAFSKKSADICFLSQPIYYSETLNGRPYSRIVDPLFEALSPQFNCLKIEEAPKRQVLPIREYSCQFFNTLPLEPSVSKKVQEVMFTYRKILTEISSIADIDNMVLLDALSKGLQAAIKSRDTFSLLIEKIQPKLLFTTCYYFPAVMGLNWAAKKNKIPTIDIQHGKQGKFQGMYSHWSKIPEEGYALLPTWFWSWGEPSVENIMKWQGDRKAHRCVVGGYPWISRWKNSEFSNTKVKCPDAEKLILITTQAPVGGLNDFFPDMLRDAIQQAPANWCWIIREHPNYKQGNRVIKEKLKEVDSNRYVMETYNNVPLYSLLLKCDFHITAYSSVCYEAEAFSVPTAIFSEIGRAMYKQEIDARNFIYFDDGESLLHAILNFKAEKNKVRYIESEARVLFSALQTVAKGSGLSIPKLENCLL